MNVASVELLFLQSDRESAVLSLRSEGISIAVRISAEEAEKLRRGLERWHDLTTFNEIAEKIVR